MEIKQNHSIREILDSAVSYAQKSLDQISAISEGSLVYKGALKINVSDIIENSHEQLLTKINELKKEYTGDIVYTIKLKTEPDFYKLKEAFLATKHNKVHGYKLSKDNDCKNSFFLYVGSSKLNNIKTRIFNHLGLGSKSVYSLHMSQWLPKAEPHNTIIIEFYIFSTKVEQTVLESIEQALWDLNKPMFGKRSGLL